MFWNIHMHANVHQHLTRSLSPLGPGQYNNKTLCRCRFNGLFTYAITCSAIPVWLSDIKLNTHQCLAGNGSRPFWRVIKHTDDYS